MDIHGKSVDMDMDMDGKFHIHGKPGDRGLTIAVMELQSNYVRVLFSPDRRDTIEILRRPASEYLSVKTRQQLYASTR